MLCCLDSCDVLYRDRCCVTAPFHDYWMLVILKIHNLSVARAIFNLVHLHTDNKNDNAYIKMMVKLCVIHTHTCTQSQPKQLNYRACGMLSYSVICVKWLIKGELIILAQDPVTVLT